MAFELQGWMLAFGISLPLVVGFIATHRRELSGRKLEAVAPEKRYSDAAAA